MSEINLDTEQAAETAAVEDNEYMTAAAQRTVCAT